MWESSANLFFVESDYKDIGGQHNSLLWDNVAMGLVWAVQCLATPTFIVTNNNSCHGVSLYTAYSWVGSVIWYVGTWYMTPYCSAVVGYFVMNLVILLMHSNSSTQPSATQQSRHCNLMCWASRNEFSYPAPVSCGTSLKGYPLSVKLEHLANQDKILVSKYVHIRGAPLYTCHNGSVNLIILRCKGLDCSLLISNIAVFICVCGYVICTYGLVNPLCSSFVSLCNGIDVFR